jgi:hypothetical protein
VGARNELLKRVLMHSRRTELDFEIVVPAAGTGADYNYLRTKASARFRFEELASGMTRSLP